MSTSQKPPANLPEPRGTVRAGLLDFLGRAKSFLLQVVYPENAVCRGCHHVSDDGCLCSRCRQELRDESASFAWEWRDLDGFRAYSLRPHRGLARSLVIRLKYQAEACLADELTALLEPLPVFLSFPPDTVVTWVPMPERRRRERCVDHARLLAESAARRLGLPAAPLLRRVSPREVPTQAGSNREARRRSLKGAFEALGPVSFPVLLVDDVLTTGTTVSRCAEALRAAGAVEITALTVTRAELGQQ